MLVLMDAYGFDGRSVARDADLSYEPRKRLKQQISVRPNAVRVDAQDAVTSPDAESSDWQAVEFATKLRGKLLLDASNIRAFTVTIERPPLVGSLDITWISKADA